MHTTKDDTVLEKNMFLKRLYPKIQYIWKEQLFMIKIREYHFIWYLIAVSLSNIVMVRKTYWFLPFLIFGTVLNQSFYTTVKATILGKGIENHIDLQNSKYQTYYNQYAYMNSSQNTNTPLTQSSCVHICEKPRRCHQGLSWFSSKSAKLIE